MAEAHELLICCEHEGCDRAAKCEQYEVHKVGILFGRVGVCGIRLAKGWGFVAVEDTHGRSIIALRCPDHLKQKTTSKSKGAANGKKKASKKDKTDE